MSQHLDVRSGPAVRAARPPQLVRRVEGLTAPHQLQLEVHPTQVIRGHEVRLVTGQSVVLRHELTYRRINKEINIR